MSNEAPLPAESWVSDAQGTANGPRAAEKPKGCSCTMAQSSLGDGCQFCNPQLMIEMLKEQITELEAENEKLRSERENYKTMSSEWLRANGPGGWIETLRHELVEAKKLAIRQANKIRQLERT